MFTGHPSSHAVATPMAHWLIADIGGTNARFAVVHGAGTEPRQQRVLACADYPTLADAVMHYLEGLSGPKPGLAAMAIATPVTGDQVRMTNHHWAFSIEETRRRLGLDALHVINDFTAQALAVPHLPPEALSPLGGAPGPANTPLAVLGPGTGLGVSGLIPAGNQWVALQGEGGHVSFSPSNAREIALLQALMQDYAHVSAERLVSGMGLVNIYRGLCRVDGIATDPAMEPLTPASVTERARNGTCAVCSESVQLLSAMLGTVTGNLVLTLGARGGFYLCGGVLLRLGSLFDAALFRQRFEDRGRFSKYLAPVPGYLVLMEHTGLLGMARGYTSQMVALQAHDGGF